MCIYFQKVKNEPRNPTNAGLSFFNVCISYNYNYNFLYKFPKVILDISNSKKKSYRKVYFLFLIL